MKKTNCDPGKGPKQNMPSRPLRAYVIIHFQLITDHRLDNSVRTGRDLSLQYYNAGFNSSIFSFGTSATVSFFTMMSFPRLNVPVCLMSFKDAPTFTE
jgi:hypothetical protein